MISGAHLAPSMKASTMVTTGLNISPSAVLPCRIQGLESNLQQTQNGLMAALSACGLSLQEAMANGSAGGAAAKRAAQEATVNDLASR